MVTSCCFDVACRITLRAVTEASVSIPVMEVDLPLPQVTASAGPAAALD
jgi:hypothetical protein